MQRVFNFDVVFEEAASQSEVFDNCGVKDLIQLALEGRTATQQHGVSGLAGQSRGLVPRSFTHIFDLLRSRGAQGFKVYATYFEIYNEQITDLLNPRSIYPHTIRWSSTSGFYVDNLFVIECDSADDLMGVLA
uniref:Kinesin motor domain-containing protein n=1 Tax=Macrostomum lignano TaxID=282301 RepID=A0A1I8IL89_9PLAT